jgi:hypothetical protein
MKHKHKRLKNVQSLKVEVSDSGSALIDALELSIDAWIEDGCDLDATNVELLLLDNYSDVLGKKLKKNWPLLYLYPKRDSITRPISGFKKPVSLFNGNYRKLNLPEKRATIMKAVKDLIFSHAFMKEQREKYNRKIPRSMMGQGDGAWDSFIIKYDTNYYNSHFYLSLSRYYTPA